MKRRIHHTQGGNNAGNHRMAQLPLQVGHAVMRPDGRSRSVILDRCKEIPYEES